jgi:Sec-independent protein translocase protein TatA
VRRRWLVVVLVVLLVVLVPGGATVVAVKLISAARGRRAVFNQVRDELARQLAELRPDLGAAAQLRAASIVAAQAVLETGGGVTPAWVKGWNFGNITAGSTWSGPVIAGGDLEYSPDGAVKRITQAFRAYASLGEAASDFLRVLAWPRYRPARDALFAGDAELYAKRLRDDDPTTVAIEGGYYTAPLAEYSGGILAALRSLAS